MKTSSEMEIRNYRDEDRESVIALWNEVFPNAIGHNDPATSIERKRTANDRLFFVATEEESMVGTVMAGYDGHRGWLYSVAVDPDHQRRGIGTQLVRHAERALAQLDCPKINLQVLSSNAHVAAFYESLGYRIEERISLGKLVRKTADD